MRKLILFTAFIICCTLYPVMAQDIDPEAGQVPVDTAWTTEFSAGLNFNQAAFSGSWKSGGINSVAFGSIIAGKANYTKDRLTWDNELELLFGIVNNEGEGTRKSNDRIFLDSKLGYKMSGKWSSYLSLNFLSQFAKGYQYHENDSSTMISRFLSPGYLTSPLGFEYKPNQEFALRLSP